MKSSRRVATSLALTSLAFLSIGCTALDEFEFNVIDGEIVNRKFPRVVEKDAISVGGSQHSFQVKACAKVSRLFSAVLLICAVVLCFMNVTDLP